MKSEKGTIKVGNKGSSTMEVGNKDKGSSTIKVGNKVISHVGWEKGHQP